MTLGEPRLIARFLWRGPKRRAHLRTMDRVQWELGADFMRGRIDAKANLPFYGRMRFGSYEGREWDLMWQEDEDNETTL